MEVVVSNDEEAAQTLDGNTFPLLLSMTCSRSAQQPGQTTPLPYNVAALWRCQWPRLFTGANSAVFRSRTRHCHLAKYMKLMGNHTEKTLNYPLEFNW